MTAQKELTHEQNSWRVKVLVSTFFGYAGYYLCRKVFGICKTSLAVTWHTDLSQVAHVWTVFLIAYMIGQFISSYIGRKWGPRLLLLGGLGFSIVINFIFGFTNNYYTFMSFMFFNGLFQSTGWPGVVGGVAEWIRPKERGTVMGVWSVHYLVGNITVKYIGGMLLAAYGWHYAFFGCTLLAFFIWWMLYFWQRNSPDDVELEPIITENFDTGEVKASNERHVSFKQ